MIEIRAKWYGSSRSKDEKKKKFTDYLISLTRNNSKECMDNIIQELIHLHDRKWNVAGVLASSVLVFMVPDETRPFLDITDFYNYEYLNHVSKRVAKLSEQIPM